MIDFMRVDVCPRCQRGFSHDLEPDEGRADCEVCRGRPVRVLVIWNHAVDNADLVMRHRVAGEAALVAADLLRRSEVACGVVVPSLAIEVHRALSEHVGERCDCINAATCDAVQTTLNKLLKEKP